MDEDLIITELVRALDLFFRDAADDRARAARTALLALDDEAQQDLMERAIRRWHGQMREE